MEEDGYGSERERELADMEANYEAFKELCRNVPVLAALKSGADLECTTWNEDPPPDSDRLIVASIHELFERYAEQRDTPRTLANRQTGWGRINNIPFAARQTVLDDLNAIFVEKKRMRESGAEDAIKDFNGEWWQSQLFPDHAMPLGGGKFLYAEPQ